MRWVILLLLALPAQAFVVDTLGIGSAPAVYGEFVVYERNGNIIAYDLASKVEKEIGPGKRPSLFGFVVAYESNDPKPRILYANIRDGKITDTQAVGTMPSVFSRHIVFSTKESDIGADVTNDGDRVDDIVRVYDVDSGKIENLKVAGAAPQMNQDVILFLTQESQVDTDLNADGDKTDTILRVWDRENRKVANANAVASSFSLAKSGNAVIESEGDIALFDSKSHKITKTDEEGKSPTIFNDVIIFERNGELFGMSAKTLQTASLKVKGKSPQLFEMRLAFIAPESLVGDLNNNNLLEELVRVTKGIDNDDDDVTDFLDNCPDVANEDQSDEDNDGVGDVCEEKPVVKPKPAPQVNATPQVAQNKTIVEEKPPLKIDWYWWVIAVVLIVLLWKPAAKYYKRKKKSFGF